VFGARIYGISLSYTDDICIGLKGRGTDLVCEWREFSMGGYLASVDVYYNGSTVRVELPEKNLLAVLEPNDRTSSSSPQELVKYALAHPEGSGSFGSFLEGKESVLVIVNDGTRPTPTRYVLDTLADHIDSLDVSFIVATGVHRGPTEEEYRFIFGEQYERFRDHIHVHDARDDAQMVYLGRSKNGTPLYVNRLAVEADAIIVIGSVEPHYFAGYTGGRKGILPGIASYETIEQNHKLALSEHAKSLALEGNPVHEDMIDALQMIHTPIFSLMTVLDKHHGIYQVTAGGIHEAFYAAIEAAKEVFVAQVPQKADIVVTVAKYPMDVDLYQAQKAIDNAKLVLKPGGVMILVAACREGLGEKAFIDLLSCSPTPQQVLEKIRETYKLGYHKAGKMAEVFLHSEVIALTELPDHELEQIFIHPTDSLQGALDRALAKAGEDAKVVFLPDGCVTVPSLS